MNRSCGYGKPGVSVSGPNGNPNASSYPPVNLVEWSFLAIAATCCYTQIDDGQRSGAKDALGGMTPVHDGATIREVHLKMENLAGHSRPLNI